MAQNKIYAVAEGRKPGIYATWEDDKTTGVEGCKSQVTGYPGAIYRGFVGDDAFDEADAYLEDYELQKNAKKDIVNDAQLSIKELEAKYNTPKVAISFVDGSFYEPSNMYSFGGLLIYNGQTEEFSEADNNESLVSMRNVAGEILGATKAMELALKNNIEVLNIFYDYEGIEKWCTGAWTANKDGTKEYRDYYNSIKNKLKVNFVKVKGHTGVELNERVDKLAKAALGLI